MKIAAILSVGAFAATLLATPVSAQERVVTRQRTVVTTQRHVEEHDRGWGRHHVRRVCHVYFRHHERIRRCRTVRY